MKKSSGKKWTGSQKVMALLGIVLIVCMVLLLPPVSDKVADMAGSTGAKIRGWAQTIAGLTVGALLVTWGIGALAIPVLGGIMIVAGLALIAWNLYPLFKTADTSTATG